MSRMLLSLFRSVAAVLLLLLCAVSVAPRADARTSGGTDLALHRPYTVSISLTDAYMHRIEARCFPDTGGRLTDGDTGPAQWTFGGPWAGYLRQDRRDIVIDLGRTQTIHSLDAWFLQDRAAGIRFPRWVTFSVSNQRGLWQTIGTVWTRMPLYAPHVLRQRFELAGLNLGARYVRVTFCPDVWCFLSEIECWGTPGAGGAPLAVPGAGDPVRDAGYLPAGLPVLHGRRREVLIYNGFYRRDTPLVGRWTAEMFLPYVAYVDRHGRLCGRMFDSFLFLPFTRAPSGGKYGAGTSKQTDWQFYADQLFTPGYQLDALDHAVARAEAALHRRIRPVSVVIAVPFPGMRADFAEHTDCDPRHVGPLQSLANRVSAVQWYVQYVVRRWRAARYPHLRLAGFYWLSESVSYALSPYEQAVVRHASAVIHAAGPYAFDWIPFHQSEGFREWREIGFDDALMQPNYAWGAGPDRLANTARLARRYGMGIEMEADWQVLKKDARGAAARANYTAYLDAAYRYGYRNTFLAWYQGYQVLRQCMLSKDRSIRQVYDDTYRFLQGTYRRHTNANIRAGSGVQATRRP